MTEGLTGTRLVVYHTYIARLGRTLASIDTCRALHRMVFRARR